MKIAIRLDDITPGMDWKKFLEFKGLLDRYGIKPLIGVVPDNQDPMLSVGEKREDFWEYINSLKEQGWVIAMHGCTHIYNSKSGGMFPLNDFAEFAGNSLEIQREKIKRGKSLLEEKGIVTDFFMAPAHAYDENTLLALKENGFTKITDGFGKYPYSWKEIIFYPISFRMSDSLKQPQGYTTMVVHTNTIDDMGYYEKMFKEHREDFISYHEYMKILPEPRNKIDRKKEYFMAKVKHYLVKIASR